MTVIRIKHNRENPFVLLNKKALWDERLSLKAVGLWSRCMSRPDDWIFNINELEQKCKEGKKAIYSAIDELIEFNYAIRIEHTEKDEEGKYSGGFVEYIFSEFPMTLEEKDEEIQNSKKLFRQSRFGKVGNGLVRNGPILNKEDNKEEITTTTKSGGGVFFSREEKKFMGLTDEIKAQLQSSYPKVNLESQIPPMILWLDDNPHRDGTKAFIRNWLENQTKAIEKQPPPQKKHCRESPRTIESLIESGEVDPILVKRYKQKIQENKNE